MTDEAMQIWEQAHRAWYRAPGSVLDPEGNANKAAAAVIAEALAARDARIEQLEAALRVLAPMVDWLPHPHCVKAEMTIRQALETKHD